MTYRSIKLTYLKKGLIFDSQENPYAPTLVYDTVSKTFMVYDSSGRNMMRLSMEEADNLQKGIKQLIDEEHAK